MNSPTGSYPSNKAKICPHCGKQVADDWLLCPNCGVNLPSTSSNISHRQTNPRNPDVSVARHPVSKHINKKLLIILGLILLALIGAYYTIGFILIRQINIAYHGKDCQNVLSHANSTQEFYPPALLPSASAARAQIRECVAYSSAEAEYNQKNWQSAYADFSTYIDQYPQGIFLGDSLPKAAASLYAWAQAERKAGQFNNAVEGLNTLRTKYANYKEAIDANKDIPQVYLEWGKALEASGDFTNAEIEYKTVLQTDPNTQAPGSPSSQLQDILPDFYQTWGSSLIAQKEFDQALLHYQDAKALFSAGELQSIQDGIVETLIRWAADLSESGDFTTALSKIEDARNSAMDADAQTKVTAEYQSILTDFSNSTGAQASQAINQAAQDVCSSGKLSGSELPIFGIDPDQKDIHFLGDSATTNGLNDQAKSSVVASSPASMHYVACITTSTIKIQSCAYMMGYTLQIDQTFWQVDLYDIVRGKYLGSKQLAGANPSGCPSTYFFKIGQDIATYIGPDPTYDDLKAWLSRE